MNPTETTLEEDSINVALIEYVAVMAQSWMKAPAREDQKAPRTKGKCHRRPTVGYPRKIDQIIN